MADNKDESTSSWYKVPTWDGSPLTWRSFRREMDWWVSSLDLEGTRKYNLAARGLLRQTGVVRQRGEEFTPKELEYQKEMRGRDDEGNETVLVEEDLLAGLHKLLACLEEINGRTTLDKRGEHQQLGRRPGERVSEFCSRFRTVVADLKQEGVKIPDSELGWQEYALIEAEIGPKANGHLFGHSWAVRQIVAEAEDEEGEAEEYNEDEGHADEEPAGLEEVLQTEAAALAAEIEELAEEGADDELIGGLEASVEAGAEALASSAAGAEVPGGAPAGKAAGKKGATAASRKASGKHPCFDCGEHGHWAGDPECKNPELPHGRPRLLSTRPRLPGVLCGRLFAFWVSIVPVPSLGLLMGRDWMEAVGAVIDFEQKVLACRRLFEGCLELFREPDPESWGLHQRGRLRRCGLDGVVELQMSSRQWLSRLIDMGRGASASAAEHVLSEASLASGREVMSVDPLVDGMLAAGASTGRGKSLKAAVLRKLGRDEAVKSFLGPKGGLPTLKAKLATLLHVEVEAKDTVDSLKKKIRTPDAGDDNDDYRYTGYGILSTYATALRPKKPKDPARPVQLMMSQQDAKFQGMWSQMWQHISNLPGNQPDEDMSWESAWRRRRREQRLISAGAHNINEVMFFQEATTYQHEVFLGGPGTWLDDLTLDGGYDFTNYQHQRLGLELIRRARPQFLLISFPCPEFSPLQRLNASGTSALDPQKELRVRMALRLARFAAKVAELQLRLGGHFAVENSRNSRAWELPSLVALARRPAVRKVNFDMCAFGLEHRKPSRMLTSSQVLASSLLGRQQIHSKLTEMERRQLRALLGSLQWLTAQLRFDVGFVVSTLQGEAPTVQTVLKANSAVRDFRQTFDFEMTFQPIDYNRGGLVVVSDAALGNVKLNGSDDGTPAEKVFSQACAFVLLADDDLLAGREGKFNILDARSHRIPRVCRSSYSAETLGAEEAMDMGLLCRGFVAGVRDYLTVGKLSERSLDKVPLTLVVDAKDVHDKGNSDTASYGTQKSPAFVVAWMRAVLRRPNTCLRWTATQNMWVDAGAKLMDLTHMRTTMQRGSWSITYSPDFVKQVQKAKRPSSTSARTTSASSTSLPGEPLRPDDPVYGHLLKLSKLKGWHTQNGLSINVAKGARSYRTPEPRFSSDSLPLRTSFGCFACKDQLEWRVLERGTKYGALPNQHALFGHAEVLITIFHAKAAYQKEQERRTGKRDRGEDEEEEKEEDEDWEEAAAAAARFFNRASFESDLCSLALTALMGQMEALVP
eukprot:s2423_g3.t1